MADETTLKQGIKVAVVTAIDATMVGLVFAQIKAAQKDGFALHGLCSQGPNFGMLQKNGVLMYPVTVKRKISPLSDVVTLWEFYRYFRREKIDIVHTHTPKCSLLGQLAAKLAGVPVIINTVHGFYFHEHMKPWARRFFIALEWIAARCSTVILCQNPEDVETAVRLGICNRDKIKLLGNGVDLSKFDPALFDSEFKKKKRKEIGVPAHAIVVGIIGRLVREKGFLELFKAMKNIMVTNEKVWLVVIGPEEPDKPDRISADAFKEYGIANRTIRLGRREDIPELLACCDVYTLPSWREGFPRSAIEATAMGLPIVATDIRGCRQVVEDGVNGLLVPLHNIGKLETAITALLKDGLLRDKMGAAGYAKARREFDEINVCQIVVNTYNSLLPCIRDRKGNVTICLKG